MQFIQLKWKKILPVFVLILVMSGTVCRSEDRTEPEIFPLYPCIQPNVDFWIKVYTQYSSDQGIIHDKRHLDRIYGVISLADPYHGGGRKINRKRIKRAKKKYKAILAKLMRGKPPVGPVENRVAEQFGPNAKAADFRTAMRNLRCQTGQKDRFREGLIRSGAYIVEIKNIFRDAGLPEDLAYLPHVESSFNPKAYSKFGAAGMWQFTRSTGKRFMRVGYTVDERRDPMLSSHAAAKLLRQNYRKLNTWPMAITAYNHGVTGMRRAQRKKGTYQRIFKEYRSRIFKFASRNFYSEFLAAREAAKNYQQYFGDLTMHAPRITQQIELNGYVSLPELARYLKLDLNELRKLNPALRRPVFRGQKYVPKGYRLQLPDRYGRDWQQLIAQLPQKLYRHNQKRSSIYTVRRGDTAGKIARVHGVKLNDLLAANNLDRRATIYVNQNLRIPLPEEKSILSAKANTAKAKPPTQPQPNRPQANQMAAILSAKDSVPVSQPDKPGSASKIASPDILPVSPEPEATPLFADMGIDFMQSTAQDLSTQSRPNENFQSKDVEFTPLRVQSGQTEMPARETLDRVLPGLMQDGPILVPHTSADPHFQAMERITHAPQLKPDMTRGHYTVDRVSQLNDKSIGFIRVEAEETLGHYADWLNVPAGEIRRLNGFRYGRPLHLNQQIKIPLDRVTKENFEEKRFEYHQELAEDFFANYRIEKLLTYSIKRGDNIWTLSRQEFEVPLWLIKRYNGDVDFSSLIPSQKLLIPIVEKDV